ncbi:MAG: hypothetical protein WC313_00955 [Candidatus Kapaibacterium sp.]
MKTPNGTNSKNTEFGKKTVLLRFTVILAVIIIILLLPLSYPVNSWEKPIADMESALNMSNIQQKKQAMNYAGKHLTSLLDYYGDHAAIHLYLGYYYFSSNNMDSTIYHESKALELMGDVNNEKYRKMARGLLSDAVINKGLMLVNAGDTSAAFLFFASKIKYIPDNFVLNRELGKMYLHQSKFEAAHYHLTIANAGRPNDYETLNTLSEFHRKTGRVDSADYYSNTAANAAPQRTAANPSDNKVISK